MRESGGRGQGPGRGAGGAGSQGGPGAARRTPGGPGRAGRQGGSARSDGTGRPAPPDNPPRQPRKRPDPLDLPFGPDDDPRARPSRDDDPPPSNDAASGDRRSTGGRAGGRGRADGGRARREDGRGGSEDGRGRPRGATGEPGSRRRPSSEDDRPRGRTAAQSRDTGPRTRAPGSRGDDDRPRRTAAERDDDGRSRRSSSERDDEGRSRRTSAERDDDGPSRRSSAERDDAGCSRRVAGERDDDRMRGRVQDRDDRRTLREGRPAEARGRGRQDDDGRARGDTRGRQDDGPRRARPGERDRVPPRRPADSPRGPRGGDVPPPRGFGRRPPAPPRPPKPPLVLRLGSPRRRINIGLIGMTFVLSIFAGRLIQMQGLDSKVYEAAAVDQRQHVETIPAKRGSITDVNGHDLAVTVEARELSIDPSKITDAGVRAKAVKLLAQQLGKSEQDMAAKLARTDTRYQRLASDVDPLVASRLLQASIPALNAKKTYRRLYPGGDLAGSLIGFIGDEGKGLIGIERTSNKLLAGRDGQQRMEIGRDGQQIPMTSSQRTAPVNGQNVRLTLDRDVQWAAQKSVADQVKESGADSGTVIVMDVRTAQIVAMANAPELDLGNWRSAPASSQINKAAADVFEPGSTNKVITAAAALEAGMVTPDTVFEVPDRIKCYDQVLRDAHAHAAESMTFRQAMAESSNVATIMAARKVGSARLYAMLKAFGFGSTPGGGVPGAEAGLLPDYRKWSGSQSCTVAYGQGVSVTALQMASVYQTIANGGVKIEPQIVAGTTDASGRFVPAAPGKQTRVVSETTAKEITTMLESAVGEEGTGHLAAIPGYRVAGKTGTANRYDAALGRYDGYTASFVGFAPADDPRLVVLSVLQNPKNGHFGGQLAAPVFKDVMTFAIKSKKIPPTGSSATPVRTRAGE
ncbi:penicillin-binding transpeptidase domain-containing protein [Nonomuraea bangladeshensis]|uniref:penicillin-binding transpeptidase domain-containing protein n=1 Tax=Nonomuraea bangladeshensis TaxID=404385 RepID=UPI003C2C5689